MTFLGGEGLTFPGGWTFLGELTFPEDWGGGVDFPGGGGLIFPGGGGGGDFPGGFDFPVVFFFLTAASFIGFTIPKLNYLGSTMPCIFS